MAIVSPAHRYGPKANTLCFPLTFILITCMTAPNIQPRKNASITFLYPRNSHAAAISFISPPPNASTPLTARPIIRSKNIKPLIQKKPIR